MNKNIFYALLLVSGVACQPADSPITAAAAAETEVPEVAEDRATLPQGSGRFEVLLDGKKGVCTKTMYQDISSPGGAMNFQLIGLGAGKTEIKISLRDIALGTHKITDSLQPEINIVSIELDNGDGTETIMAGSQLGEGAINITKSGNNLLSGTFSGSGVVKVREDGSMVRGNFQGQFTDVPLQGKI